MCAKAIEEWSLNKVKALFPVIWKLQLIQTKIVLTFPAVTHHFIFTTGLL